MHPKQPNDGISQADRAAQERARSLIDRTISDRYRIRELIAMGGMGAVYRAEHLLLKKRIAIKILHPETENLPELVKRFEREAIAGAHIQHPNVASATDFGKLPDGSYFLCLEYVKGKTLHQLLQGGPLSPRRAARLTRQLASALDSIHRLDIVHRDLKPRNIMVVDGPKDIVKIIDLGLAKVKVDQLSDRQAEDPRASISDDDDQGGLTVAGTIFGTIAYLSPEAAEGMDAVDGRSDLYALGLMFYEMLGGKHPFTALNPVELFMQHRFEVPKPILERSGGVVVPASLEAIARKLLEKQPVNRYQTGQEVANAIDTALRDLGPDEQNPSSGDEEAPTSEIIEPGELSGRINPTPSQRPPAVTSTPPPSNVGAAAEPHSQRPPAPTLVSPTSTPSPVSRPSAAPVILLEPKKKPEEEPEPFPKATNAAAEETEAPAPPPPRPRKKKLSPITIALTIVAGLGIGYAVALGIRTLRSSQPTPPPPAPQTQAAPAPPKAVTPQATAKEATAKEATAPQPSAAPAPSASAAVEPAAKAPSLSAEEAQALKKKFKDAFRFHDWRGANKLAIDLGKGAPDTYKDKDFAALVSSLAITLSKENAETDLMTMFADDLGADGLDILYAFIEGQGKAPIAMAASKLLADPKRLEKATPAMRIALEFRNASCVERLSLFDRAGKEGDSRARLALETLGRACFPANPDMERIINELRIKASKR